MRIGLRTLWSAVLAQLGSRSGRHYVEPREHVGRAAASRGVERSELLPPRDEVQLGALSEEVLGRLALAAVTPGSSASMTAASSEFICCERTQPSASMEDPLTARRSRALTSHVAIADTEASHHIKRLNGLDSQDVYLRLTAIRSAGHRVLRARKE